MCGLSHQTNMMSCFCMYVCVCSQSSVYSLTLKSIISLSTLVLLGLIVAYHCCEVQVSGFFVFHYRQAEMLLKDVSQICI